MKRDFLLKVKRKIVTVLKRLSPTQYRFFSTTKESADKRKESSK